MKLCLDNNYSRDIVNTTRMNYFKTENMHYAFIFSYRSKTRLTISMRTGEWSVKKTIFTFCFKWQVSSSHVRGICILTRTATIPVYKKNCTTAIAVVWVAYQSYVCGVQATHESRRLLQSFCAFAFSIVSPYPPALC